MSGLNVCCNEGRFHSRPTRLHPWLPPSRGADVSAPPGNDGGAGQTAARLQEGGNPTLIHKNRNVPR